MQFPNQTKTNLYERMKGRTHWDDLYKKIRHTLLRYYAKEFILQESWVNKSDEKNEFDFHTHKEILLLFIMRKITIQCLVQILMNKS